MEFELSRMSRPAVRRQPGTGALVNSPGFFLVHPQMERGLKKILHTDQMLL